MAIGSQAAAEILCKKNISTRVVFVWRASSQAYFVSLASAGRIFEHYGITAKRIVELASDKSNSD